MATPSKTRGEYRPIYEALFHGKDYRVLSPAAKLCLVTLKGLCGVTGIRPWQALPQALSELTGYTAAQASTALKQLAAAGWIEYEDGVVWVVRGLEFEPQMTARNTNHRKSLAQQTAGLPNAPIVARFRARYAEYFGDAIRHAMGDGMGNGIRNGMGDAMADPHPTPPHPTTTPPLPHPTTTDDTAVVGVVVGNDEVTDPRNGEHRLRLVVAANKGITERFGEQTTPITGQHGGTTDCTVQLAKAGVPIAFAERALFTAASNCRPGDGKAPVSLRYFAGAIVRAWQAEQAHRATATAPTPTPLDDRAAGGTADGTGDWAQAMRDIAAGKFVSGAA